MATELDVFGCPLAGIRLIEASAGTGKTWNLCGLVLRLLLERELPLPQILVVTFTNAATAELRERIRARVAETLAHLRDPAGQPPGGDPFVPELLARLRQREGFDDDRAARLLDLALQSFDEAAVFTIHGFCQRALADTPISAQMPLTLELLTDDSDLRQQVVNDFWRREVAGAALPPELADALLQHRDSPQRWAKLLKQRLGKPLARLVWPEALDAAPASDASLPAFARLHAQVREHWQARRVEILDLLHSALPELKNNIYKPASLDTAAAGWDEVLEPAEPLQALNRKAGKLDLLSATRLADGTKKNKTPPVHPFFSLADDWLAARDALTQAVALQRTRLLRALLQEAPAELQRRKREARAISFDDMLANLHQHLTGPEGDALAATLRQRFPAALIDEFQDTDPLQWSIFQKVYRHPGTTLFLVGDPKQAIYRFRHADLGTYLRAREAADAHDTLAHNQRSQAGLIEALNALFSGPARPFMQAGLDYPRVGTGAKPRPAWRDDSAPRAPLQLWTLPRDEQGQPLRKPAALDAALQACAGEIARLLNAAARGEVQHAGRPLVAGDIAVLVRSHRHGRLARRALAALGVDSVELSQASVFASPEAECLAWLLAAVLEPQRSAWRHAVLATEAMGWRADEIAALATDDAAALALLLRFAGYREAWQQRGIGVMLRQWMQAEGVNARLLSRPDGERRLTNLLHLAELLHEAAQEHGAPEALLRWLNERRADPRHDDTSQLRLESDRALVQIVTVHKSKGLEYPLVFCPLLWDGRLQRAGRGDLVETRDAQGDAVLDLRGSVPGAIDKTEQAALKQAHLLEEQAEALRLIYVALTRAVQRCTVVVGPYLTVHGRSTSTKQATQSPLNWLVADGGMAPEAWVDNALPVAAIDDGWAALAARCPTQIGLAPLPMTEPQPLLPQHTSAAALQALPPPAVVPSGWRIGSYSGLVFGAEHDDGAADHDHRAAPLPAAAAPPALADDDILRFPRGAAAGECLHAVFEEADFSDAGTWDGAIARALRRHPQPAADCGEAALAAMARRMLADVLNTPLQPGLQLASLPRSRRLSELEFSLPARALGDGPLNRLLAAHGAAMPRLTFGELRGWLRGFIDGVFEHQGRWYLVDWKSNHLGHDAAAYGAPALARAMAEHGYPLQAWLYALALHRWLGRRLRGYAHERHFGGVFYLFVRGVRPGWTGPDGQPAGVWFERTSLDKLAALSALLGDGVPA